MEAHKETNWSFARTTWEGGGLELATKKSGRKFCCFPKLGEVATISRHTREGRRGASSPNYSHREGQYNKAKE